MMDEFQVPKFRYYSFIKIVPVRLLRTACPILCILKYTEVNRNIAMMTYFSHNRGLAPSVLPLTTSRHGILLGVVVALGFCGISRKAGNLAVSFFYCCNLGRNEASCRNAGPHQVCWTPGACLSVLDPQRHAPGLTLLLPTLYSYFLPPGWARWRKALMFSPP